MQEAALKIFLKEYLTKVFLKVEAKSLIDIEEEAKNVFRKIMTAISYMHDSGVVHR
jgi:serine/threonine protein kinase